MYQKWPDQIFPIINFVFSHDGHFGLGRGEGVLGEGSPPLWFLIILKKPWGTDGTIIISTATVSDMYNGLV